MNQTTIAQVAAPAFNRDVIAAAFAAGSAAESTFALLWEEVTIWRTVGEYPNNAWMEATIVEGMPHITKGTCKTYASKFLTWARSKATPRNLYAMVTTLPPKHKKRGAGRPAGSVGEKKRTQQAANEGKYVAPPVMLSAYLQCCRDMRAHFATLKAGDALLASDDIKVLQDTFDNAVAIFARYVKAK